MSPGQKLRPRRMRFARSAFARADHGGVHLSGLPPHAHVSARSCRPPLLQLLPPGVPPSWARRQARLHATGAEFEMCTGTCSLPRVDGCSVVAAPLEPEGRAAMNRLKPSREAQKLLLAQHLKALPGFNVTPQPKTCETGRRI